MLTLQAFAWTSAVNRTNAFESPSIPTVAVPAQTWPELKRFLKHCCCDAWSRVLWCWGPR